MLLTCFYFSFYLVKNKLSSCLEYTAGRLWDGCPGSNCCYMVLQGYMLFLYVAYFPDLGTVGNNDCCCRSNDVGNFFFLFHYCLLILSQSPFVPPSFPLSLSLFFFLPIISVETTCSDFLTLSSKYLFFPSVLKKNA